MAVNSDEIMLIKNVLSWMRRVVQTALLMPESDLKSITVGIAGVPVKILSNDPDLLSSYRDKWFGSIPTGVPTAYVYLLQAPEELQSFPWFSVSELSPAIFHKALAAEKMIATYPSLEGQIQWMDCRKRVAIHMFRNRTDFMPWESSAPLRIPFQWILATENLRLAHAAVIGDDSNGIALFGKGGSGKSGTTLAGLAVGMNTVGDDYIALGIDERPFARAVFNHVKQDEAGIERIPGLRNRLGHAFKNWRGKYEFQPGSTFPGSFVSEMRVSAAVVPTVAHQIKPSLEKVGPADVLLALINSNAQYDPSRPDGGLRFFADFLRMIPCYRMNLSIDALENGRILNALLSDLK